LAIGQIAELSNNSGFQSMHWMTCYVNIWDFSTMMDCIWRWCNLIYAEYDVSYGVLVYSVSQLCTLSSLLFHTMPCVPSPVSDIGYCLVCFCVPVQFLDYWSLCFGIQIINCQNKVKSKCILSL